MVALDGDGWWNLVVMVGVGCWWVLVELGGHSGRWVVVGAGGWVLGVWWVGGGWLVGGSGWWLVGMGGGSVWRCVVVMGGVGGFWW